MITPNHWRRVHLRPDTLKRRRRRRELLAAFKQDGSGSLCETTIKLIVYTIVQIVLKTMNTSGHCDITATTKQSVKS